MTWTALNSGLTGSALNVNHIAVRANAPKTGALNYELLAATDAGLFIKRVGTYNWAQITLPDPSNAEFGDSPAATVDELEFHWVAYDPRNTTTFYVMGVKSSVSRIWIYRSVNAGATWTSRGVTTV